MKILSIFLAFSLGQMNTLQSRETVRLAPSHSVIDPSTDGKKLQLLNSLPVISLPAIPPKPASRGELWSVDIQNLGPAAVSVVGKPNLNIKVNVNETVHLYSDGATYSQKR